MANTLLSIAKADIKTAKSLVNSCKTANCGRSFLRIVFDDSSFQTALSGRMKRDFVGIAAGFRRFISADHRWSVETRL